MENLFKNLSPFYVGQKVVYLSGIHMPKGSIHTVRSLKQFTCGCWVVDIGRPKYFHRLGCANHVSEFDSYNTEWFLPTAFAPLQQTRFPLMTFSQIKEKEEILINN